MTIKHTKEIEANSYNPLPITTTKKGPPRKQERYTRRKKTNPL